MEVVELRVMLVFFLRVIERVSFRFLVLFLCVVLNLGFRERWRNWGL